jgi:hypothetical protein
MQAASLEDLPLEERLTDAPRPGSPARITDVQGRRVPKLDTPVEIGALLKRSWIVSRQARLTHVEGGCSNRSPFQWLGPGAVRSPAVGRAT